MSKSLEELKNEMASRYANKQGVAIAKKVKVFTVDLHLGNPQQYDYEYSKNIIAEYAFIAGFDAAIKAVSERGKKLMEEIEKIKSENISLKIDHQALENSNRKLNEANARIVEFEDIKKSHLATIEKLKKSREGLRKQLSNFSKLEISTNVSYDTNIGKKAREALEADNNLMKEV